MFVKVHLNIFVISSKARKMFEAEFYNLKVLNDYQTCVEMARKWVHMVGRWKAAIQSISLLLHLFNNRKELDSSPLLLFECILKRIRVWLSSSDLSSAAELHYCNDPPREIIYRSISLKAQVIWQLHKPLSVHAWSF